MNLVALVCWPFGLPTVPLPDQRCPVKRWARRPPTDFAYFTVRYPRVKRVRRPARGRPYGAILTRCMLPGTDFPC